MPLNPNKRIESLELSMLEKEEEARDFVIETHQTWQLTDILQARPLGPAGRRLLNFLQTGEGQTPELLELLRRVCVKIKLQVRSEKEGMVDSSETLSADNILEELPGLIHEVHIGEALNRFGFGCKPEMEDSTLLTHILEPDEMAELKRRYTCAPPYNRPPDELPFESVPSETDEE